MNNKLKTFLGILLFVVLIGAAYFSYSTLTQDRKPNSTEEKQPVEDAPETEESEADPSTDEKEVIPAPDFTVYDVDGNEVKLSDFAGKPIVLNFWASWCPPCKLEMPHFNKVYQELGDEVVFMMVDLVDGQQETKEKGLAFIEEEGFEFPVYFDSSQEAAYTYGISSIPLTLLINAEGNVVTGYTGAIDKETLMEGIEMIK